ncbi:type II toxin-antitoxin system RelE/ParE family toxin [Methylovirgula sp. HY1]|uniref:type II toxin-antitoxin system RelE/ParE family toxin n=1 Tax=Methylovirgula sp. HY1 TaxID=2822761 RepID=UPI001C5B7212|nr:type II toxin-antitoxin system RelE/ParE family toxin [Methylovirgula sp. HY1]QXX76040.1 Toxin ParE1 [Methylovirgula sp. HY1]
MVEGRGTAIWSPEALADVDEIWNYYERVAGRNTAEKIVREIGEVVATIEDHPFAGRSRNELRPGFRSLAASPHVVFYRVVNDAPEIIRVLDGRQDIEEIFADREDG